jgi:hypothetical protein
MLIAAQDRRIINQTKKDQCGGIENEGITAVDQRRSHVRDGQNL